MESAPAPAAHLASLRRVRGRAAVGRVHVTAAATTLWRVALGVMRPLVVIPLGRVVTLGLRLMTRRSEVVRPGFGIMARSSLSCRMCLRSVARLPMLSRMGAPPPPLPHGL